MNTQDQNYYGPPPGGAPQMVPNYGQPPTGPVYGAPPNYA